MGKKTYTAVEIAKLFSISERQVYRLIKEGCFNVIHRRITHDSIQKYLDKYIKNCPLPIYKPDQIAGILNISTRKIHMHIKRGHIKTVKINPHSKSNKTIRIPLIL